LEAISPEVINRRSLNPLFPRAKRFFCASASAVAL
jgi:hypothetical protein